MKNTIAVIIALLFPTIILAQNFQGKVTYEWKASSEEFRNNTIQPDMPPEMKKFLERKMELIFHKIYALDFDKSTSIYKEERIMTATGDDFVPNISDNGVNIASFKDVKAKELIVQKEFYGKDFTIKEPLENFNWKLESETKKIGEYLCYKATAIVPFKKLIYEDEGAQSTNFFVKEKITERTVTAWYAPEIPVSQGPENYWGLPGLILEINDGNAVTLCTKIVMNPKEKSPIKPLIKGKIVSQKEYDAIVFKKNDELQETETTPD